jgi:hypothetical protein
VVVAVVVAVPWLIVACIALTPVNANHHRHHQQQQQQQQQVLLLLLLLHRLGRGSETNLVQAHELWLRVFGAGTYIVADKGAKQFNGAICGGAGGGGVFLPCRFYRYPDVLPQWQPPHLSEHEGQRRRLVSVL